MSFLYNIPELIGLSQNVEYNPALASAVNKLIRVRNEDEYNVLLKEATDIVLGYESQNGYEYPDYGFKDKQFFAGVPIFQPVFFEHQEQGEEDLFLQSAVINLSRAKNIIQTVVQGRDSSIKEFINNGDWIISVNGIFCDKGWNYPIEKVQEFNRWMEKNKNLQVTNEILNGLGIYELVILDYTLSKTPHINCQPYSFNAVSDSPLPLIVEDFEAFNLPVL